MKKNKDTKIPDERVLHFLMVGLGIPYCKDETA
jgi:hypothetical protein